MNFLKVLLVILASAAVGYFVEPRLRPRLIPTEERMAGDQPIPDWVARLEPTQLPAKVGLKRSAMVRLSDSPEPVELPVGTRLKTVRIEGDQLVVNPFQGASETMLPIRATDLLDLLGDEAPAPREAEPEVDDVEAASSDSGEAEPAREEAPAEMPDATTPTDEGETEELDEPEEPEESDGAVESDGGEEELVLPDEEVTEAAPVPEESEAGPVVLDDARIVALMQEVVRSGALSEFSFQQVQSWQAGGDTEFDGETFQSGLLVYRAETAFGVTNIEAKALIRDGSIERWIWPKSGMEIK